MSTFKQGRYSGYLKPIAYLIDLSVLNGLAVLCFFKNINPVIFVCILSTLWVVLSTLSKFYAVYRYSREVTITALILKQMALFTVVIFAFFGFYYNDHIEWTQELKVFWKEQYIFNYINYPYPLLKSKGLDTYFNSSRNDCYADISNDWSSAPHPESFMDENDENFQADAYKAAEYKYERKLNLRFALASLDDAKYKVEFYQYNHNDFELNSLLDI